MEQQSKPTTRIGTDPKPKPLRNSHLDQHVSQSLVQTCFFSMGAWHHLGNPGLVLVSGTPPTPHWGWGHNRKNYIPYECLSPGVCYKNRRAPTSPWPNENRPVLSVKRYPRKLLMTTSGSVWPSVGRVMARRETETVGTKEKKTLSMTGVSGFFVFCSWI